MILAEYRKKIIESLSAISDSPREDAELLLMAALSKSRTALITALNEKPSDDEAKQIEAVLARRKKGEPIAYILGHQAFWTMDLTVTRDTLIPRPETECLVDWILTEYKTSSELQIADLGTGSGAIALALAREKPEWQIDAVDESYEALAVARQNALKYGLKNVAFYPGDWCGGLPNKKYDVIVSNPPYIAPGDSHLPRLQFEPQTALVSEQKGLHDIDIIAHQAKDFLKPGGALVIEHGFDQAADVKNIFEKNNFLQIKLHRDLSDNPRFLTGLYNQSML